MDTCNNDPKTKQILPNDQNRANEYQTTGVFKNLGG